MLMMKCFFKNKVHVLKNHQYIGSNCTVVVFWFRDEAIFSSIRDGGERFADPTGVALSNVAVCQCPSGYQVWF